jgi:cytoskeleton protein RodZ
MSCGFDLAENREYARPAFPLFSGIAKTSEIAQNKADMPTVAEQLRTAREAQKLTVHQVAETTKIRTDHIQALEEGNFNIFPAPVYIRGFIRSYAMLLKLDVPQVTAALDAELSLTEKFSEPPPLSNQPRGVLDFFMLQLSRVNWRKAGLVLGVVGFVAVIVGGYVTWRHYRKADPLAGLPPAVYQPAGKTSGETLPLPNSSPRKP